VMLPTLWFDERWEILIIIIIGICLSFSV
jgi:hypothetical protein